MPGGGMSMWPPFFPAFTITERGWPEVHEVDLELIKVSPQYVLLCSRQEELDSIRRSFGGFSLSQEVPKNHFWTEIAKVAA
jgi:hypothetical protein